MRIDQSTIRRRQISRFTAVAGRYAVVAGLAAATGVSYGVYEVLTSRANVLAVADGKLTPEIVLVIATLYASTSVAAIAWFAVIEVTDT